MTEVLIKTDGSCVNNGMEERDAIPGCAFIVTNVETGEAVAKIAFKPESDQPFTENRCEAFAILGAVKWLKEHKDYIATFESDSKTIVDGIVGLARRRANRDIWEQLESEIPKVADRILGFNLVRREENAEVDQLAKQAALAICIFPDIIEDHS